MKHMNKKEMTEMGEKEELILLRKITNMKMEMRKLRQLMEMNKFFAV